MNALVHQRAAVLRPGTAPRGLLIVRHCAVPKDARCAVDQLSKTAVLQRLVQLLDRCVKAVLMAYAQGDLVRLCLRDHLFCISGGERHRLFHQHMLSVLDAVEGDLRMVSALRRNRTAVDLHLFQHLFIVRIDGRAHAHQFLVLSCLLFCALRHRVTDGNQFTDVFIFSRSNNMIFRNTAAADEGKAKFIHLIPSSRIRSSCNRNFA